MRVGGWAKNHISFTKKNNKYTFQFPTSRFHLIQQTNKQINKCVNKYSGCVGCVCVCWGCIGGVFVATHSPDGWLVQGSVFILRRGDIRRFVIPWRCRVFHIAPHPWDHISSPHPQSPNRFIYRLSSCTYIPPSNTCILLQTRILMHIRYKQQTCSSTEDHKHTFSEIKSVNTHGTHFLSLVLQCSLWVSNEDIQQYCQFTILVDSLFMMGL